MSSKEKIGINLLKKGYSYGRVSLKLGVAKSTINSWFNKLFEKEKNEIIKFRIGNWKKSIKENSLKIRQRTIDKETKIQNRAARKVGNLSLRELFLVGVSLYWGEGTKKERYSLQFSNSDPEMVKIIMRFFREVCKVNQDKFYMQMILHKNVEEKRALNFWSSVTSVSKKQFKKACYSQSKSSKGKRSKNSLPYGTLQVRILNKQLTHKIYGYVKGLKIAGVVQ